MAQQFGGFTIEQKVVFVSNTETDINNEITTQSADLWTLSSITISGTDVILLFSRTTVT